MSHAAEPDDVSGYQRFDCAAAGPDELAVATDAARRAIEQGQCIVLPTDTVYGIGADAFSAEAVRRLLEAKHRGRDMPPPVLIGDASLIRALATDVPDEARELIERHWPGPLTVICRIQPSLRMDLGDTEGTIALRVPDHALAREVLRRTGPMAVSSANLSGKPAALSCDEAVDQLGDSVAVYLDGGHLDESRVDGPGAAPSTIVDFTKQDGGEVLRLGALSLTVLRETLPDIVDLTGPTSEPPRSASPEPVSESVMFEEGAPWEGDDPDEDEPDRGDGTGQADPNQPDLFDDPDEPTPGPRPADG